MKIADYAILRGIAVDVLGEHLRGTSIREADTVARAGELLTAGLGAAETAAAGLLYYLAFMRLFEGTATPDEREALAQHARAHAQTLAAYLPERQAAELLRLIVQALPEAPATPATPTAPSGPSGPETIEQRQARRLARLRALGGDRKRIAGQWRTTGHGALARLVAEETAAGCAPVDEKGVRRDLTAAAERERAGTVEHRPFAALIR